ncbi:HXXEE domain-containing protein [filamentous cyanobacterium LEGE 11480]|uniref:HXXEE domain-containing protein n=1 Tax=Romeriopsis navalis LEGE 11480 TaxID=2777977 RepID=A0A928Z6V7_9CYAN|nr:HXXEE domain-containing protein [Romeriopsis navalis]MBE9033392.1 HXXEE domain-containing protein [Romeriopsis navalis LEGE 11480]
MDLSHIAIGLLAFALILHTFEEGWLPEYHKVKPDWRSVVFNRPLLLDNLPIFIFAIILGAIGWRWPIISGILPAIGITHPLFDHVGLSWKAGHFRPGGWTAIFLLFPLSLWIYVIGYTQGRFQLYEGLISGSIGLAISIWLVWVVLQETPSSP